MKAKLIKSAPGNDAEAVTSIEGLTEKSIILVGERLSESTGALSSAANIAAKSGAKLAWVPRRAGERAALEAGAIGNLLPGGRPVNDPKARVDIQAAWGCETLPAEIGRDTESILRSVHSGEIEALLIGGVDPSDISADLHDGLAKAFVVSLEIRESAITKVANVVLPVAAVVEKSGTFLNWEGRSRSFEAAISDSLNRSDVRILSMLADEMGTPINLPTVSAAAKEFSALGNWDESAPFIATKATSATGDTLLASWRLLLDTGTLQDGEANLAGTAHRATVVISPERAIALGVSEGDLLTVSTARGSITLPCQIADIESNTIWAPRNSVGSQLIATLGIASGPVSVVRA